MCDYSLHAVNNRLAVTGESLFVHRFYSGSKGLASLADLEAARRPSPAPPWAGLFTRLAHYAWEVVRLRNEELVKRKLPAVCIPPGARLRLSGIPAGIEDVTFTQITSEPFRYRDAVRFDDGEVVLLQSFDEGVRVEVLSLELKEEPAIGLDEELVAVPTNPGEWRLYSNG